MGEDWSSVFCHVEFGMPVDSSGKQNTQELQAMDSLFVQGLKVRGRRSETSQRSEGAAKPDSVWGILDVFPGQCWVCVESYHLRCL